MAAVDLVFSELPAGADLVFNATGAGGAVLTLAGKLPALMFSALLAGGPTVDLDLAVGLPALQLAVEGEYVSGAERPTAAAVGSAWQVADWRIAGAPARHQQAQPLPTGPTLRTETGAPVRASTAMRWQTGVGTGRTDRTGFAAAVPVPAWSVSLPHQDGVRTAIARSAGHQEGVPAGAHLRDRWQDRYRDRRPDVRQRWQVAQPVWRTLHSRVQDGQDLRTGWTARHQWAMRPPPGMYVPPVPPVEPPNPCYTPSGHLVFLPVPTADGPLVFFCESAPPPPAGVVVPIRRVYIVINTVSLRRVDGDVMLPALGMSLAIDVDSWTWSFSATLPAGALPDLEPEASGQPAELEASINGSLFRVLAERVSVERQFGAATVRVGGRGKSALLAAPYAPAGSFGNAELRTAQQLMADVLTVNGVPLGWAVDWQLTDWPVPAGALAVQGTYMDALVAIAGAAGGYLQPHPTDLALSVLPRYPSAPWTWGGVVPDFELPAAVAVQDGVEWVSQPQYNRVFVSGASQGVLGQVTRTGTAGDLAAPMVTDALITHADAARQRGLAVLADTGRQARVSLRLPVLPATGIIVPGDFVRYVDGATTRIGIVRGASVDAGFPEVWQSIQVETHV